MLPCDVDQNCICPPPPQLLNCIHNFCNTDEIKGAIQAIGLPDECADDFLGKGGNNDDGGNNNDGGNSDDGSHDETRSPEVFTTPGPRFGNHSTQSPMTQTGGDIAESTTIESSSETTGVQNSTTDGAIVQPTQTPVVTNMTGTPTRGVNKSGTVRPPVSTSAETTTAGVDRVVVGWSVVVGVVGIVGAMVGL